MGDAFGGKPFGMREIQVEALPAGSGIALPAAMTLKFKERTMDSCRTHCGRNSDHPGTGTASAE